MESNYQVLVKELGAQHKTKTYLHLFCSDCHNLGALFHSCIFSRVRREGNKVAHTLDKDALLLGFFVWLEDENGPLDALNLASLDVLALC